MADTKTDDPTRVDFSYSRSVQSRRENAERSKARSDKGMLIAAFEQMVEALPVLTKSPAALASCPATTHPMYKALCRGISAEEVQSIYAEGDEYKQETAQLAVGAAMDRLQINGTSDVCLSACLDAFHEAAL